MCVHVVLLWGIAVVRQLSARSQWLRYRGEGFVPCRYFFDRTISHGKSRKRWSSTSPTHVMRWVDWCIGSLYVLPGEVTPSGGVAGCAAQVLSAWTSGSQHTRPSRVLDRVASPTVVLLLLLLLLLAWC
ncbi:hypothetical protein T440DRAFT_231836 [Plenodomus tracheiphilus IPT5]|uniref:Secreted protein n=1 Tax=Plenodomus tracheiphilus IPT5 TaxID=1408161 RepID=A0A6A7ATC2_9PLEO|nr:hypothetical protein T440DRAFT_231836 [Plenodomus tracheiphilus IPT5]